MVRPNIIRPALARKLPTAPVSGLALAEHMLHKNAVKFGDNFRKDTGKAYPFFYSFVPYPFVAETGINYGSPANIRTGGISGEGPDGYTLAAAFASGEPSIRDIYITMDRDLNFDLLELKYSVSADVYVRNGGVPDTNLYAKAVYPMTNSELNLTTNNNNSFPRYNAYPVRLQIPNSANVRVSVYIQSGQERSIYGGASTLIRGGDKVFKDIPVPIANLQGCDDGKNSLRTPYLIAAGGIAHIRAYNYANEAVRFNGYLFGYKVAY